MALATWTLDVDWNNDSSFTGTGEALIGRVLNSPGITCVRGRDQIRALAPPMAGSLSATLNNASKDYSPANTSSPLTGKLVPGRAVRLRATAGPGTYPVWRGHLDDIPQHPFARGGGLVTIPSLGPLARLKGILIDSDLYTNITTDVAFAHVCRLAGLTLTTHYAALDTGKTTLAAWWCGRSDAFAMLVSILAAEGPGAAIYEDGAGVITFHSRHYRLLTARCTTSQATFGNAATEPKHSPPFGYEPNLKGVVNCCAIPTASLTYGAVGALWTYGGGTVELAAGAAQVFDIALSAPAQNDLSTNLTIASSGPVGSVLGTIERYDPLTGTYVTGFSGTQFRLTVTNGTNGTATLTQIRLDGGVPTVTTAVATNRTDTSASQAKYGTRTLPTAFAPWPHIAQAVAEDFCDAIVTAYQEPRATVTITVNAANDTRQGQQLAREISDRITVQEAQTGFASAVYIERIAHTVAEGGRVHRTEFGCEATGPHANYLVMDSASKGIMDTNTMGF